MMLLREHHFELPRLSKRRFDSSLQSALRHHIQPHELDLNLPSKPYSGDIASFLCEIGADHFSLIHNSIHHRGSLLGFEHSQNTEVFLLGGENLDDLGVKRDSAGPVDLRIELAADEQGSQGRVNGLFELQKRPERGYE